jgi:hypothetical protein
MLGERVDLGQGLERLSEFPVLGELDRVQRRPFAHQPQRSRRQRPIDDFGRVEPDLRDVLAVLGVKMGRGVIGSVHVDDDPIELADPRHQAIVSNRPDDDGGLRSPPVLRSVVPAR